MKPAPSDAAHIIIINYQGSPPSFSIPFQMHDSQAQDPAVKSA